MYNIIKNIFCLLFINIFANASPLEGCLIIILMYYRFNDNISDICANAFPYLIILINLIVLGRLFVLPIAYKHLENSQRFNLVAKFIKKLKKSGYLKLLVLIIAYFCYCPLGLPYFSSDFHGQLIQGIITGLLGSYIVLFIYWFLEDKIKKFKKQSADKT